MARSSKRLKEDDFLNDGAAMANDGEGGGEEHVDPPARERPAVRDDDISHVVICKSYASMFKLTIPFTTQQDGNWPHRESLSFTRSLIFYGSGSITPEHETAAKNIEEARLLRKKYHGGNGVACLFEKKKVSAVSVAASSENGVDEKETSAVRDANEAPEQPTDTSPPLEYVFGPNGVVEIYEASDFRRTNNLVTVPSLESFVTDYQRLVEIASSGALRSFAFQRLQMLTAAFKMHITINGSAEDEAQSGLLGTDFYRTMKVDNHIHLAAAASAKQFVNFVRDKLENEGDTVVMEDGQTLKEVFEKAGLDSNHLTIDAFNVLADYSVYQRFDNFNNKYSPFRMAQMRKIFLKTDNHIDGRYFAELTKIVLARHEQRKGHTSAAEMRLSIYGMERNEWLQLAKWVLRDWKGGDFPGNMISTHNRWLVQVPRLWRVYCKKGKGTNSFQQMLENLFIPLFEATLYPEEHPEVAELLNHIVGFDSVDDEGSLEVSF